MTAAIVVVGAGILGTSTAWHLAQLGATDVLVVEAGDAPACGTSGAGAGFVGTWAAGVAPHWGKPELDLEHYSLAFYRDLQSRTDIGLQDVGNLFVAFEPSSKPWLDDILTSPSAPADVQRLEPEDVARLTGLDLASVHGAVLHPSGAQLDPPRAVEALAAEASAAGVTFRFGARARFTEDGALLVDDEPQPPSTVIVAAGAWTAELLAPLGIEVPQVPTLVTRTVDDAPAPRETPTLQWRDLGGGGWARNFRGNWCFGVASSYRPATPADVPSPGGRPEARMGADAAATGREHLQHALPELCGPHVVDVGLPCFTSDHRHLVGFANDHPHVLVLTGDNEAGISHGPGLGRIAAHLASGVTAAPPTELALDRAMTRTQT